MHRVIDFQDDLGAAFIASDSLAADLALFKEAAVPEAYELADRDFALHIVDDALRVHRKFACQDAGNTWMSLWYLENVPSGLPEAAVKVAAAVLYQAAQDFGLTDDLLSSLFPKTATQAAKMGQKIEQGKLASAPAHMLDRRVRVRDVDLVPLQATAHRKEADFDKVAQAVGEWDVLDPYGRRVRALELSKVASVVDIPDQIQAYMGDGFGPNLQTALSARAERVAKTAELADGYRRVAAMAKLGSIEPETAVEAIHVLDQESGVQIPVGYGPRLPDPYVCVYGLHKQAMWSWTQGAEYVNEHDLRLFAASAASADTLGQLFEDSLVEKFRRDPVKTFDGMPREQQHIVARAATQSGYRDTGGLRT